MDINNTNPQDPGLGSTPSTSDDNNGSVVSTPDLGSPVGTTADSQVPPMPSVPTPAVDLPEMPTDDNGQASNVDVPVAPSADPVINPAPAPEPVSMPIETPTNETGSQESGSGFDPAMPIPGTEEVTPSAPVMPSEPASTPATEAPTVAQLPVSQADSAAESSTPAPTTENS